MAGETVSLDYTPATVDKDGKVVESETPLYPGLLLLHEGLDNGSYAWRVARVTQRIAEIDARRGLFETREFYPGEYTTQDEALAAAKAHFLADGPGDMGGRTPAEQQARAAAAQAVHADAVAANQPKPAPASPSASVYGGYNTGASSSQA